MKRVLVVVIALSFMLLPTAAFANHLPPAIPVPSGPPLDVPIVNQGGVRYIGNLQSGRSVAATFGENPPFVQDGRTYMLAGSSFYGLSTIDITDPLKPVIVSEYASAFGCPDANVQAATAPVPSRPLARAGVTAELPFGGRFGPFTPMGGFENDISMTPDGKIAVLAMDATGRCHDPVAGGLEFVDLTDVRNPRTLHLTRNVGDAHSVTIDPAHPWLAYISNSDQNRNDFVEIVDFSSCLGGVAALAACKPSVARTVFDVPYMEGLRVPGKTWDLTDDSCHDLRFRGMRAYCAAIDSTMILDTSGVTTPDGRLTGTDMTKGPNACTTLDATKADGVTVTDCLGWTEQAFAARKGVPVGMKLVSVVSHDGDPNRTDDNDLPPDQDVQIAHQAEAIGDGTIMMITDERGGGLANENGCPGGGVWFWDIRNESHPVQMRQPDGAKGVYITKINAPPPISLSPSCTVHYGNEFADENLLAVGWYMNGTRVVRYTPDFTKSPPEITFEEVAAYLSLGAMTIHSLGVVRNPADPNEIIVYAGDAVRGIDILGVSTPRITRRQAFKFPVVGGSTTRPPPRVLGGRNLANTGLGDPSTIGLALLALALATKRSLRPHRAP